MNFLKFLINESQIPLFSGCAFPQISKIGIHLVQQSPKNYNSNGITFCSQNTVKRSATEKVNLILISI
jgi:hypothetical protein